MSGLIARLAGRSAYAHGQMIEVGGWPVRLCVSPRARRVSLRIDRSKREAIANAPNPRRLAEAVHFARSRADWIGRRLASLPPPLALAPGVELDFLGERLRLEAGAGRARLDRAAGRLTAPADAAFGARAVRLLKAEAKRELAERTAVYAARLGKPAPKVSLTDARRRWGSCSPPRAGVASIRYSWRLALAPISVADYVVAHECAHLVHMDHSANFWNLLRELYGEVASAKAWLNLHGDRLHAVTI